jgi:hypothetical protein
VAEPHQVETGAHLRPDHYRIGAAAAAVGGLAVGAHPHCEEASTSLKGPAVEPRRRSDQPSVFARTDVLQMLGSSRPAVSSLSAATPYAASRRTALPGSVTLLSRADVVPRKAATDLVKGRAWPDTEGVTGSNPVAPTHKPLTSGNAGQLAIWGPVRQTVYRMDTS